MKIVDINKYKITREKKIMEEIALLVDKLNKDFAIKHNNYTLKEIDDIAYKILHIFDVRTKNISTPIVKISKKFGFKICKKALDVNLSGDIFINGNTCYQFNHDKVILVNKNDELYHQRFVIAHELAHYLFDFLGNPDYFDKNVLYSDTYFRNNHNRPEELIANRFAASILMPSDLFIEQYQIALETGLKDFFVIKYLSEFFETSLDSIEKRIEEVMN